MASKSIDWYQHLVNQSKTDHIYTLIHGYLRHDWDPGHDLDFVVLRTSGLPHLFSEGIPTEHHSPTLAKENYSFPGNDYLLLHNNHLTKYLEAAKRMQIIEDFDEREFIELLFTNDPVEYNTDNESSDAPQRTITDYRKTSPETLENKEDAIAIAYELLRTANEQELAFSYARTAETFLNDKKVELRDDIEASLFEVERIMLGYNVVAMVYAWNNKIDEAARVDSYYLRFPNVWDSLESHIGTYLEMLTAKKQEDYLKFLFDDRDFRNRFLAHYEAYISLLVNDRYELTKMHEVVGIINRVNNANKAYL